MSEFDESKKQDNGNTNYYNMSTSDYMQHIANQTMGSDAGNGTYDRFSDDVSHTSEREDVLHGGKS